MVSSIWAQVPEAIDLLQRDTNMTEHQRQEELVRVHTEAGFVYFQAAGCMLPG